jgi:hypothetical protein
LQNHLLPVGLRGLLLRWLRVLCLLRWLLSCHDSSRRCRLLLLHQHHLLWPSLQGQPAADALVTESQPALHEQHVEIRASGQCLLVAQVKLMYAAGRQKVCDGK